MAKKNYEVTVEGNKTELRNVDEMLSSVRAICQKVEKAQDAYKQAMEITYLLNKHKVHKQHNMSFTDFMRIQTGMGATTAKSLVAIWKTRLVLIDDMRANKVTDAIIGDVLKEFDSFSMRQLLKAAKYEDGELIAGTVYEYALLKADDKEASLSDMWNIACEAHETEELKLETKVGEDTGSDSGEDTGSDSGEDEGQNANDAVSQQFIVETSADLSALNSEITALLQTAGKVYVTVTI